MADRTKRVTNTIDYKALHEYSTADTYSKILKRCYRSGSKLYDVERIISRRKVGHKDHEYLLHWKGWPISFSSWEPSAHIPDKLLR